MGRFNGIKYSGALKTNSRDFKRLKVRRSIDLMELEDRGTIAEGKSDLPTRGAAHRRHRDGSRRGARGATVNTVDLGYVSGVGSNVVDNQDFGFISDTALTYNQTINQQRFGSLDEVTTDSVNTPVWNPNANTTTFIVTVGPKTGGGNAFYLDSGSGPVEAPAITLDYGQNYIFDVSDSSNSGHPFAFTIDDGVSEYTRGIARIGSPGQDKAKVRITIPNGNAISGMTNFKYYCTVHGTGMGNTINLAQFIPTYTITPAANNVDEGSRLDFTVSTNDNISVLYWNVVGYTAPVFSTPDINGGSGSFSIHQNGTGFFSTGTMLEDSTTEGAETFAIEFRTGSSSGPVVATSDLITINDTSTDSSTGDEETIPQVTALQGSMTIGDTATLSATGISKFTPTENFTANVKMWGAAGGNGTNSFGGRGGYTEGTYEFQAGTTYQILVGQGGKSNNGNTGGVDTRTGGGGRVGVSANSGDFRGTGGGYTGLFDTTILQSNALLIAGGGGGGGPTGYPGTDANAGGGDGGGTSGTNGSNGGFSGGGQAGTQLAGGDKGYDAGSYASTNEAGSALLGGGAMSTITENYSGSGGGGGYFGGGGGGGNNYAGGAGGGGSSYIHTSITNGQTISGVDIDNKTGTVRGTVPGSTETEWNGTAGSQAATRAKEGEAPDGQITITVIDPITGGGGGSAGGSALSNQGDRGIFGGGRTETTTASSTIQYIDISTAGDASSFGSLTVGRRQMAAFSSGSRGVFAGGIGPSTTQTTIDYITIASLGAATDFGDMTTLKGDTCGLSDQTRGIIGPSYTPQVAATDVIDYVTIATPSNSSDFGDMTVATFGTAAAADATRGLIAGGFSNSRTSTIEYITIQTIGNATGFGDLTSARYQLQGLSDDTHAVFAGGDTSTTISNTIDYVTVATTGQAAAFGILTVSRERMGSTGSSNGTYGVFGGGGPSSTTYTNTMDYVTISTPGDAVDFGDHITAVRENPGFSGSPS